MSVFPRQRLKDKAAGGACVAPAPTDLADPSETTLAVAVDGSPLVFPAYGPPDEQISPGARGV